MMWVLRGGECGWFWGRGGYRSGASPYVRVVLFICTGFATIEALNSLTFAGLLLGTPLNIGASCWLRFRHADWASVRISQRYCGPADDACASRSSCCMPT